MMMNKTLEDELVDVLRRHGWELLEGGFKIIDDGTRKAEWVIRARRIERGSVFVCDYCGREFRHMPVYYEDEENKITYIFCSERCRSMFIKNYKKSIIKKVVRELIKGGM